MNIKYNTPEIIKYAKTGNSKKIEFLLKKDISCINDVDSKKNTALNISCKNNFLMNIIVLLKYNADVNIGDIFGDTPLMNSETIKITNLILNVKNLDVNIQNNYGATVLHNKISHSNNNVSKHIVNKILDFENIDVNLQTKNGYTPLMFFVDCRKTLDIEIFKKLINKGANPYLENIHNQNFYYIFKNTKDSIIDLQHFYSNDVIDSYNYLEKYINKNHPDIVKEWNLNKNIDDYNL